MAFYYRVKSSVDQTLFSDTYTDKHTHIHMCIYIYICNVYKQFKVGLFRNHPDKVDLKLNSFHVQNCSF